MGKCKPLAWCVNMRSLLNNTNNTRVHTQEVGQKTRYSWGGSGWDFCQEVDLKRESIEREKAQELTKKTEYHWYGNKEERKGNVVLDKITKQDKQRNLNTAFKYLPQYLATVCIPQYSNIFSQPGKHDNSPYKFTTVFTWCLVLG